MGLTKPRAAQIYNLDYKQSTRVVTVANVTLSGGAPATVDGVTLSVNDRILVTGQSTASQNGLYYVTIVGSGSNGTWTRTSDGNETGEIEAGMIVMVTEGTIYADTQWKLITDDPIVIGTTALTFTQNYSANSISAGTSNVVVNSNANVTVSSAGTANVLTISSTGTVTSGTGSVTGNITGGNILTAGIMSSTGNGTHGNILTGGLITATGNIQGGNILTAGLISATGNITGGNILGGANVNATTHTGTTVSVTANVTGGNILTGGLISATGNVTGGNILGGANVNATTHTGTTVSVTANVTGGNVLTGGLISATGNVSGANLIGNVFSPAQVVINANGQNEGGQLVMAWANVGNLTGQGNGSWNIDVDSSNTLRTFYQNTTGTTNVMFTLNSTTQTANFSGNIGATYYYGNGAFLTGISGGGGGGGSSIANGATNISIPVASGNITMSVAGQSNTVVVNLGSLTMYGAFAGPKMLEANVSVANAVNGVIFGPVTVGNAFNITVPDASTVYIYSGT